MTEPKCERCGKILHDATEENGYKICNECAVEEIEEKRLDRLLKYPKNVLVAYLLNQGDNCELAFFELDRLNREYKKLQKSEKKRPKNAKPK